MHSRFVRDAVGFVGEVFEIIAFVLSVMK